MSYKLIGAGFPRLMARFKDDPPIELMRGSITTADRLALTANMHAPDWDVWVARATPVGELLSPRPEPADARHVPGNRVNTRLDRSEIIELDRSGITDAAPTFNPYTIQPEKTGT